MQNTADLILENADVISCGHPQRKADLVAVRDGNILFVGTSEAISTFKGPDTRVIDCQHKVLAPGFIDPHCHFFALVRKFLSLDLSPAKINSIEALKQTLHLKAESINPGYWIIGTGYNEFHLKEKRHPQRQDLDLAVPDHPIMIVHRSMHACILNTLAMRMIGITSETEEPPGGMIDRDLTTGEPNGILYEMLDYVQDRMNIETPGEKLDVAISDVNTHYLSLGITSIGEATLTNGLPQWETYMKLKQSGQLRSRVCMMPGSSNMIMFKEAGLISGKGDNQLRIGPLKVVLNETTGRLIPTQNDLNIMVLEAVRAGFQVAIHAVELSTVEAAVNALEYAQQVHYQIEPRFRIEHCSECSPAIRQRLAKVKAVIVSQPSFLYFSGDRYLSQVRPEAQPWLYTFNSWLESGLMAAGSSDSPVVPGDPLTGIYAAVTRRTESGKIILPGERVNPEQAYKMFTLNAAYATFEEKIKGSIAPGKLADMVLLNRNPITSTPEQIKDIKVEMTIIDGKVEWEC